MNSEPIITIIVIAAVMAMLIWSRRPADSILWGGLTLLLVVPVKQANGWKWGILSIENALAGFTNPGIVTLGVLFVVVTGLRDTGAMHLLTERLLGRPKSVTPALLRTMLPVAGLSAFMNNTPLVAMMLPVLDDWSRKVRIPISKLLIPLSYASILGGSCTLIGTSTTLVVSGMLAERLGKDGAVGMFDLAWVGIPNTIIGCLYLIVLGPWLIPNRKPAISPDDDPREYTVEMLVSTGSPISGKTIESAGLRHLPGLYLMEICRGTQVLPAVSPNITLQDDDRLVFVGMVESVVDLQKIRGLVPATDQVYKLSEPRANRCLVEAVVSNTCGLVGQTIREGRFRTIYNAAVIAVARNGERIRGKLGDIRLDAGDTLLLETRASFPEQHRNSKDFFLVSRLENSSPPKHERAYIALGVLALMVLSVTFGLLDMLRAALIASGLMLALGCCTATSARRNVDWQVLMVIVAAYGLGRAMETSGAVTTIVAPTLSWVGPHPMVCLTLLFATTMFLANIMNTQAAAVLMMPIAFEAAQSLGVNGFPLGIAVLLGAVYSFATPIGYQTNLMVYGPGGYRFSDFLRVGGPLSLVICVTSCLLIHLIWPFQD